MGDDAHKIPCPECGEPVSRIYYFGKAVWVPRCTCMFGDSWGNADKLHWKDLKKKKQMTDWWNNLWNNLGG